MDLASFGLARRPFRPTPDTDLYFPAGPHEAAAAALRDALDARDGVALVDGPPGVGKTLVALRFLETLPPDVPRVVVPAARFARPADLFQAVLFDFGTPFQGLTEHELRLAVTDRLLAGFATGHPTVLVLDEAQHLGPDLLEEIRLLGNLETRSAKAAFVVLVAQPALRDRLGRPDVAAFAQRVAVRPRVETMSADESARFLLHQIAACGADPADLISAEALHLIAGRCGGVPRVLNQAANLALGLTAAAGESTIDCEATLDALAQLGLADDSTATADDPVVFPAAKSRPAKRLSA